MRNQAEKLYSSFYVKGCTWYGLGGDVHAEFGLYVTHALPLSLRLSHHDLFVHTGLGW